MGGPPAGPRATAIPPAPAIDAPFDPVLIGPVQVAPWSVDFQIPWQWKKAYRSDGRCGSTPTVCTPKLPQERPLSATPPGVTAAQVPGACGVPPPVVPLDAPSTEPLHARSASAAASLGRRKHQLR